MSVKRGGKMRGIITLLVANLKKRKSQSILTAVIIAAAAVIFTASISISRNVEKPFDDMYKRLNASQVQLINKYGIYDTSVITDWWQKVQGITVQTFKCHYSTDRLFFKGQVINDGAVFYTEKPDKVITQDKLEIAEGINKNCPSPGEVWVCISFADKHKAKLGDNLEISTKDGLKSYKISAIVADPQFGSPSMGALRIWTAPGELNKMFDLRKADGDFIGLHFSDYSKRESLWKQFENFLGKPFTASIFDYEITSASYIMQYQIEGSILMVFSFILLLIALFIIIFTISTSVASDVKTIGILKAQGHTSLWVTTLYALQYIILAIIAVPFGILAGSAVVNTITATLVRSMGITSMDVSLLMSGVVAFATIVSIVGVVSFLTARKAGRLSPVNAMREYIQGVAKLKNTSFYRMKKFPVSVILAVRQIFTQKGQSLILFVSSLALSAVLVFSINMVYSFSHLEEKSSLWGFDMRNDTIGFKESADSSLRDNLYSELKKDSRLKAVVPVENIGVSVRIEPQNSKDFKDVSLTVYEGDVDSLGTLNLKGRSPAKNDEISISVNVERFFGKSVGDYLLVSIGGKKSDFLITGVYQSMLRAGWGIRAQNSLVKMAIPSYSLQDYAIIYRDLDSRQQFIDEYTAKYKGMLDIQPFKDTIDGFMSGVKTGINSFVVFLGFIFTLVVMIVIFNSTLVNIYKEKKIFGVIKAVGLTPLQARMSIVWRIVILTLAGVLVGVPLSYAFGGKLVSMMISGMGIVDFPMVNNLQGMLIVIPICLLVGFVSSWIPSGKIKNISPRDLILE